MTFELLASIERQAGCRYVDVQVNSAQNTVGDALLLLQEKYPVLREALDRCACAIDDAIVRRNTLLPTGKPVVLLPPVSGG